MKLWAQRFINLMTEIGVLRLTLVVAGSIIVLGIAINVSLRLAISGDVDTLDIARALLLGFILTPPTVFLFVLVVRELDLSRRRTDRLRAKDREKAEKLEHQLILLEAENAERVKAEQALAEVVAEMEAEVMQRRQAEIKAAEQSAKLGSLIDSSPDVIFYRDDNGYFSSCNRAAELLLGRTREELVGLTPADVYPERLAEQVVQTDAAVMASNRPLKFEQWMRYPDGRKTLFEFSKVPFFGAKGERLGLVAFGRDITERKQAADLLSKASNEKAEFIATISHELRTPLNGIVGLSRILRDTELSAEQLRYVDTIYLSAETLGVIFNDIVDLDRLDRQQLKLNPTRVAFKALLAEVENMGVLLAQQYGVSFRCRWDPELPEYVEADGARLRQVLWNLLGNAVKFTPQGFVALSATLTREDDTNVYLQFEIEDTGLGIPDEEQKKIFAMYYQGSRQGHHTGTGSGIGLAISQQLVRAMGSEIKLRSEVDVGSCFSIQLTLPKLEAPESHVLSDEAKKVPALNILLVEDIELNVLVAKTLLEKMGHTISVAMDGQSALTAASEIPDLVLLDIQLPDMSGFDVAEKLKADPLTADIPLVALTANTVKDKTRYEECGIVDIVTKPIQMNVLHSALAKLFAPSGTAVPTASQADDALDDILDIEMLQQYSEVIGAGALLNSVELLETLMPEYLEILESNLTAEDKSAVASEAHKIKGAAGSVGLKRVQQIAAKAQQKDEPAWWENVPDWVDAMKHHYPQDLMVLKRWLTEAEAAESE
ncbi:aerobic respiration two-component sensor histidine kinase ArcB [Corallincola holothuriorum]|uniref:Aerobic respiration control sensor protein n=1 Tax=Corallincola holothuriorum TaxID=2282215 RepID=A0A368NNG5_9GAMM|nr:aerobic respiration two-component sensor histidine kinase ArcB [Corallincola holothuriorum]RCU51640.1 aerobic respiration two-component sensor histidine kinase ArcB [Corallincola holothuriorum]